MFARKGDAKKRTFTLLSGPEIGIVERTGDEEDRLTTIGSLKPLDN